MHRSTQSSASRGGHVQDSPTQPNPAENPSPVDNNTSTDGAILLSSTTAPRFTGDELETIADNVPNRSSRNLSDIKSTAVFPYMLEPDKTKGFPFSVETNKHYTKTAMYHPGQFSP
jgi:hypothetical protein